MSVIDPTLIAPQFESVCVTDLLTTADTILDGLHPTKGLPLEEPAFIKAHNTAMQHQLFQCMFGLDGAQPHAILEYTGTGLGSPLYMVKALEDCNNNDWEVLAIVDSWGVLSTPESYYNAI